MRRLVLCACLICFVSVLTSCKKNDDHSTAPDSFYIRAKFNGVEKIFNASTQASTNYYVGPFYLLIGDSSPKESFIINIWSENPINTGDAFGLTAVGGSKNNDMRYNIAEATPDKAYGVYYPFSTGDEKFECTITERGHGFAKGTFSGTLIEAKYSNPEKIEVTEGEFIAKMNE